MKRLWEYMKPYKRLAILAPILMLLEVGAELAMPKLMTFMINQGVGTGNTAIITKTGIEMLVIAIIGIIGGIGCLICATLVSQRTGTDLRRAAFEKIQEFSFHNIDTFSTPSLITRLTNDITQIQLVIMICLALYRQYHHGIFHKRKNCGHVFDCGGFACYCSLSDSACGNSKIQASAGKAR